PLAAYSGPLLAARRAAAKLGGVRTAHFTYLASRGPLYLAQEPHYRDADLPAEALSGGEAAMFSGYGVVAIEACCGSRIGTVSATMASGFYPAYRAARMEDLAHLVVSLDNGAQATITVGRTPHPGAARIELELFGPNGDFRWSQAHDGAPQPDGIDAFIDDLVAAAQTGRAPYLGAAEVLSTVAVLGAAYRSAAVGEPVAVPDLLGEAGEGS
ncbi:MAG: hypothetical protein HUU35_08295, partial [Armatimonadetes bacterium]|nr:hypothetical protein [Armatimonadota bacterium]